MILLFQAIAVFRHLGVISYLKALLCLWTCREGFSTEGYKIRENASVKKDRAHDQIIQF